MSTFEYTTITAPSPVTSEDLVATLNAMGAEGWQVVDHDYGWFIFMREVTP